MAKIFVTAKPFSKKDFIEKNDETHFIVTVKEPPIQGRANRAILSLLSKYFQVPINSIKIISGFSSRNKIIEIATDKL